MNEFNKRLVEVETILKQMSQEYQRKIPYEIWEYIEINKDKNYNFVYDENKALKDQVLHIDTISILTYINMEYLLEGKQKEELEKLLKKDDLILEQLKISQYNPNKIFKNEVKKNINVRNSNIDLPVEIKKESFFMRFVNYIKNLFIKIK